MREKTVGRLSREAGGLGEYSDDNSNEPQLPAEWPGDLTSVVEPDPEPEPDEDEPE
jgi:hypothetical protein